MHDREILEFREPKGRGDVRCASCAKPTGLEAEGGYVRTGDGTPLCHGCWTSLHEMARQAATIG